MVRAVAIARQMPYAEAHELCRSYGRKDRRKFHCFWLDSQLWAKPVWVRDAQGMAKSFGTVKTFVNKHDSKVYIVRISGHAFAVVKGYIMDMSPAYVLNRRVKQVWEVSL